jgi:hypothetical protein
MNKMNFLESTLNAERELHMSIKLNSRNPWRSNHM